MLINSQWSKDFKTFLKKVMNRQQVYENTAHHEV